jgi:molecular chaperone GrpE
MADPRRETASRRAASRRAGRRRGLHEKGSADEVEQEGLDPEVPDEDTAPSSEGDTGKKTDDLVDRYQRLAAEFDNYRKRQARDFNRLIDQGRRNLVMELLTVLDNFDRARSVCESEHSDKEIVEGIMQTSDQLLSVLRKEGLEEVSTAPGDPFDPNVHEAMFAENIEEGETDIVLEVYQKAYRFGQDLIRPARVKVGKVPAGNGG